MVIGIDTQSANKEKRTGVEWYAYHVIQSMKSRVLSSDDRVILYTPSFLREDLGSLPAKWESKILKWPLKRGWMQGRMSLEFLCRKPNIFFVPGQGLPRITPRKKEKQQATVTTIHDVGFLRYPHLYSPSEYRRLKRVTRRSTKKAQRFFVPSLFTKQELMDFYAIEEEHIFVTPLGVEHEHYHPFDERMRLVLQNYRLAKNTYFFSVGRLEKKKNTLLLIQAFNQFKMQRGIGDPFQLVLAGSPGFGFSEIKMAYEQSPYKNQIQLLGWIPQQDIPSLMAGAAGFLFPSWYEGFGIPNLEALACGTPLLASDIPVHREVALDCAQFLSPEDPLPWAKAMAVIVEREDIVSSYRQKGLERAKEFSWSKTADLTWQALCSLFH